MTDDQVTAGKLSVYRYARKCCVRTQRSSPPQRRKAPKCCWNLMDKSKSTRRSIVGSIFNFIAEGNVDGDKAAGVAMEAASKETGRKSAQTDVPDSSSGEETASKAPSSETKSEALLLPTASENKTQSHVALDHEIEIHIPSHEDATVETGTEGNAGIPTDNNQDAAEPPTESISRLDPDAFLRRNRLQNTLDPHRGMRLLMKCCKKTTQLWRS